MKARIATALVAAGTMTAMAAAPATASGSDTSSKKATYQAQLNQHKAATNRVGPLDSLCQINGFRPTSVSVGTVHVVQANFSVQTSNCTLSEWSLDSSAGANNYNTFFVYQESPSNTWDPAGLDNSQAGYQDVVATADNADYSETTRTFTNGFALRRNVSIAGFNASEPVKKGAQVHVVGSLSEANWDTGHYDHFVGHHVAVQFRPSSAYPYVTKATVVTNASGNVSAYVTDSATGDWRLYYGGTSTAGATASSPDNVAVY